MNLVHRPASLSVLALVAALASTLAACSSDDSPSSGGSASTDGGARDGAAPSTDGGARADSGADGGGGSLVDASTADGDGGDGGDAGPAPTCGPSPARYTPLAGSDDGLAKDNVTGLVWMREDHGAGEPPQHQDAAASYCEGRGMRLPTKAEAVALAAGYASCAFGRWSTWTSTASSTAGDDWVVDYQGGASPQIADNFPSAVLCVR